MAFFKGGALRLLQTLLYFIIFCCAAIILGIYSYFLAFLADRHDVISTRSKAIEGISGAAVLYLIFATILTCCLGGVSFFAFSAIVLDILFLAGMIAIAVMTRRGSHSCSGVVSTPIGTGDGNLESGFGGTGGRNLTYGVKLRTACHLNQVAFAVSVIAAVLFLFTALMQLALVRHHKKEKRFGPSPKNNYTSGYGKGGKRSFWQKKNKNANVDHTARDTELGDAPPVGLAVPAANGGHDIRPSHETGYTGTTVGATNGHHNNSTLDKVEPHYHTPNTGYHTQPTGTGVNPYGYDNAAAPGTHVPGTHTTTTTTTGTATNY